MPDLEEEYCGLKTNHAAHTWRFHGQDKATGLPITVSYSCPGKSD